MAEHSHNDETKFSSEQLLSMLKWYREAGVDIAMSETPDDRYAEPNVAPLSAKPISANSKTPSLAPAPPLPSRASNVAGASPAPSEEVSSPDDAKKLANKAKSLDALKETLENFHGCGLRLRATQLVFADGNPKAKIMLIGEAPGRDEDLQGKPFVGRSGQLLDRMLGAIGLDRTSVYIANTVPWRPPGNRTPSPLEISLCLPFLIRQVELVAPEIIVTLGAAATQTIFDEKLSILRTRGKWRDISLGSHSAKTMPTLHPAFLLRQPAQKKQVWQDMLKIRGAMDELGFTPE